MNYVWNATSFGQPPLFLTSLSAQSPHNCFIMIFHSRLNSKLAYFHLFKILAYVNFYMKDLLPKVEKQYPIWHTGKKKDSLLDRALGVVTGNEQELGRGCSLFQCTKHTTSQQSFTSKGHNGVFFFPHYSCMQQTFIVYGSGHLDTFCLVLSLVCFITISCSLLTLFYSTQNEYHRAF